MAINDFHGNLKPPLGGIRIKDPADATKTVNIPAGGAEYLASAVDELAVVREADRTVKAAARERKAEAAKRSRKPGPRKTTPRPRARR